MKFYRDLIYRYYYNNLLYSDNTAIYCNENYMFFIKMVNSIILKMLLILTLLVSKEVFV